MRVFLIRGNHEDRSVNKQYPRSPRQWYPHSTGCRCGPTHAHRRARVALGTAGRAAEHSLGAARPKPCRRWPSLGYATERRALSARHAFGIRTYAFQAECVERLGVHIGQQCWEQFNAVFDWLVRAVAPAPAAAARLSMEEGRL